MPGILLADPIVHQPTGIAFPDEIAEFTRGGEVDYESRSPGAGYSYGYNLKPNIAATVYVYSATQCPVPSGTGDAVARMREQTIGEIRQVWALEGRSVDALSREVMQFKGEKGDVGVFFDLFKIRETEQTTALWLWAARGHFVKVRLTNVAPRQGDDEKAREFVAGLVRLADAPPPKSAGPRATIGLHPSLKTASEAERNAWTFYGVFLLHWTMQCIPLRDATRSFTMPYAAMQFARAKQIQAWRETRSKYPETVPYMEEMIRIEEAGFLDDYLWRYLANPSWGSPPVPVSARRAEFERWMAENLPAHQPQTKAVISISTR